LFKKHFLSNFQTGDFHVILECNISLAIAYISIISRFIKLSLVKKLNKLMQIEPSG